MDKYDENFNLSKSDLDEIMTLSIRKWVQQNLRDDLKLIEYETLISKFYQDLFNGMAEGVDFENLVQIEQKPDWLDLEKIKIGQKFAQDFYSSVAVSEVICLIFVLSNDKVLRKLISTNKSSEPYTAFKRYLSTGERVKTWLFSDLFDENSQANKNIKVVNAMHQNFYKKLDKIDQSEFLKLTELSNCPFLNIAGKINTGSTDETLANLKTNELPNLKTNSNKSASFSSKMYPTDTSKINPEILINESANSKLYLNKSDSLFSSKLNPEDESSKINPELDVLFRMCTKDDSSKFLASQIILYEDESNSGLDRSDLNGNVESTFNLGNLKLDDLINESGVSLNKSLLADNSSVDKLKSDGLRNASQISSQSFSAVDESSKLYQLLNEDLIEYKPVVNPRTFLKYSTPMTQTEMCGTQFSFVSLLILYPENFGIDPKKYRKELDCFCHLWRYLGYRLGTKDEYNLCSGSFDEIRLKSQFFMDIVVKPVLQTADHKWEHMTRSIMHGLHYYTEGASFEAHLIYGLDLIGIDHPKLDAESSLKVRFEVNLLKFLFKYLMSVGWVRNLLNRLLYGKIKKVKENMPSREEFYYKTRHFGK